MLLRAPYGRAWKPARRWVARVLQRERNAPLHRETVGNSEPQLRLGDRGSFGREGAAAMMEAGVALVTEAIPMLRGIFSIFRAFICWSRGMYPLSVA